VSTNKGNIVGQPEIAMWPPKPKVLIFPTIYEISLQFRSQTSGFRPWRARRKCQQVTIKLNDNRNSYMVTKTENSYTTETTTDSVELEIRSASPGFSTMASPNKVSLSDCDIDR